MKAMITEKIQFTGSQGDKLAAVLEKPDSAPRGYALFAHCFTCTKDIFSARYLTAGIATEGFAVLRFDFTGLGASEGEFANTNFSSNVADLVCAADYLREQHDAPVLIIGHSLGGAAVLAAAGDIPEIRAVATIGAPAEPAHVKHLFKDAQVQIQEDGEAEVLLAGRPFKIKKQFLEDIEGTRLEKRIASLDKALLVMHSVVDNTVEIGNAKKIYQAAKHPKSFVSLDRADHLLTDKRDAIYAANILAAWAEHYLPEPRGAADTNPSKSEVKTVIVSEIGSGILSQKIYNGKHELVADAASDSGGANTGPTPYGYLLGALGSCITMSLRNYAKQTKLALSRVTTNLSHEQLYSEDYDQLENSESKIKAISVTLILEGNLSDEQKANLLQTATQTPLYKSLQDAIQVNVQLGK